MKYCYNLIIITDIHYSHIHIHTMFLILLIGEVGDQRLSIDMFILIIVVVIVLTYY